MINPINLMREVHRNKDHAFDVVLGFDMETDIGSYTTFYEGVQHGTPLILEILLKHRISATFFWTGHAAEKNQEMVVQVNDAGLIGIVLSR